MLNDDEVLKVSRIVDRWAESNLVGEVDWGPLVSAMPSEWCVGFMWMQRVDEGGVTIEVYKHGITRRHLLLDHDGRAYRFTSRGYAPTPLKDAIAHVFGGIEKMGWSRETVYDDDFIAMKYRALRQAGWTIITTSPAKHSAEIEFRDQSA